MAQTRTLFAGIALAALSATTMVNAVFWQDGRHPAPFAETRSFLSPKPYKSANRRNAPDAIAERVQSDSMGALSASEQQVLVSGVQEALSERGLYTGSIDGLYGPKTESAIKKFEREAGLQVTGRPSPDLLGQIKYRDMLKALERSAKEKPQAPRRKPAKLKVSAPAKKRTEAASEAPIKKLAGRAEFNRLLENIEQETRSRPGSARKVSAARPAKKPSPPVPPARKAKSLGMIAPAKIADAGPEPRPEVKLVQRGLAELGYSPGPADGVMGESTHQAIREFQADRALPVTGTISTGLINELRKVTGVSILNSG